MEDSGVLTFYLGTAVAAATVMLARRVLVDGEPVTADSAVVIGALAIAWPVTTTFALSSFVYELASGNRIEWNVSVTWTITGKD